MKDKSHGSDLWLGILLKREGITMAHIIIIVDHLGKGSSLPIAIAITISKISQGKNQIKEMEIPTGKDLRMLDGSDFWLESSSEERLHVRTA